MVDLSTSPLTWGAMQLLAVGNLALCLGVAWGCICRLNTSACRRHWRARLRYVLLLAGALAHGAQPLFFATTPGPGGVIFSAAVLSGLALGVGRWRAALTEEASCK